MRKLSFKENILLTSLFKTMIIILLFTLSYKFYDKEIVRENIEDIAFDTIDKFVIAQNDQNTTSPKVLLFSIDDTYLRVNKLLDDDNETNYGYFIPNDKIAKFLDSLDEFVQDEEPQNRPKVLFLDFDFSFTTAEYGKKLNSGDKKLLLALAKDRNYTILLPKTSKYNFIEHSKNARIQELIRKKKIIFTSVDFQVSEDGTSHRYLSYKNFKDKNATKDYINIAIAIKYLIENGEINTTLVKKSYKEKDIIANRIWLKDYKNNIINKTCSTMQSYWQNYTKYSASCNLYDLEEEDFANAIILFGSTHSSNDDIFNTLNVFSSQNFYGIEMHANAIETLFYLNGQLKRLGFWKSIILIFIVFFTISFGVTYLFYIFKINNSEIEFLIALGIVTLVLMIISIYLLNEYKLWFNWFVPLIFYELIEILEYIQELIENRIKKE